MLKKNQFADFDLNIIAKPFIHTLIKCKKNSYLDGNITKNNKTELIKQPRAQRIYSFYAQTAFQQILFSTAAGINIIQKFSYIFEF